MADARIGSSDGERSALVGSHRLAVATLALVVAPSVAWAHGPGPFLLYTGVPVWILSTLLGAGASTGLTRRLPEVRNVALGYWTETLAWIAFPVLGALLWAASPAAWPEAVPWAVAFGLSLGGGVFNQYVVVATRRATYALICPAVITGTLALLAALTLS